MHAFTFQLPGNGTFLDDGVEGLRNSEQPPFARLGFGEQELVLKGHSHIQPEFGPRSATKFGNLSFFCPQGIPRAPIQMIGKLKRYQLKESYNLKVIEDPEADVIRVRTVLGKHIHGFKPSTLVKDPPPFVNPFIQKLKEDPTPLENGVALLSGEKPLVVASISNVTGKNTEPLLWTDEILIVKRRKTRLVVIYQDESFVRRIEAVFFLMGRWRRVQMEKYNGPYSLFLREHGVPKDSQLEDPNNVIYLTQSPESPAINAEAVPA